jgi:hypothetical protein
VIRVGVAYKNGRYFFPAEVKPAKTYLGALASVKQKKLSLAPQQYRCQMALRQGHHPPAAENKGFKIHLYQYSGTADKGQHALSVTFQHEAFRTRAAGTARFAAF